MGDNIEWQRWVTISSGNSQSNIKSTFQAIIVKSTEDAVNYEQNGRRKGRWKCVHGPAVTEIGEVMSLILFLLLPNQQRESQY